MTYNSNFWKAFRKFVPFKVRWVIAFPFIMIWFIITYIPLMVRSIKCDWSIVMDQYNRLYSKGEK